MATLWPLSRMHTQGQEAFPPGNRRDQVDWMVEGQVRNWKCENFRGLYWWAIGPAGGFMGWGLRGALALLLVVLSADVDARLRPVAPGDVPELREDEGLVLVAVDSSVDLYRVRLMRNGRVFGSGAMEGLARGHSYALYVATVGDYEWVDLWPAARLRYTLRKHPEFRFTVRPGHITYPGDLLFRPWSLWRADMQMYNRGLAAIDWLEQHHPALMERHGMAYSGRYPDPFPDFFFNARRSGDSPGKRDGATLVPPPDPGELPIAIQTLFQPGRVVGVSLNPAGDLLALHLREDDEDWSIDLIDLRAGTSTVMAKSVRPFTRMEWSGNENLLVTAQPRRQDPIVSVIRITHDEGRRAFSLKRLPTGEVVDALVREPGQILYATRLSRNSSGSGGYMMVHRMDISTDDAIDGFRGSLQARLNGGLRNDSHWLADGEGRLRAAVVRREDEYVVVHGEGHDFRDVMSLSADQDFELVGLSSDASRIYGITDDERGQRELVVFDVASRSITETLFSRAGTDVVSALLDDENEVIGVTYYSGGRLVSEYFLEQDQTLEKRLQAAFPGSTVALADRSSDRQQVLVWVDAGDEPPRLFHVDVGQGQASPVADLMPWLDGVAFAPTQVVSFTTSDGLAMEAFLTIPDGEAKRPLVIYPHGGPIGVADTMHFDPEVQLMASLGYAVLRVNFRGSEGYGRAFREAGLGNFGRLIEDDLDAALQHVLERFPLDAGRMCMVGYSYGGYSALISSIRWPDRFRCAVSMAGVADLMLLFTASDTASTAHGRSRIERMVGNPGSEAEVLQSMSPVYRFQDLKTPIMLVHGREDRRVDFEHSHRMLRLLAMQGQAPAGLVFDDEGHSIRDPENVHAMWRGVMGFLRQHLDHQAFAPDGQARR